VIAKQPPAVRYGIRRPAGAPRAAGRFARERDHAIASLLGERPMSGRSHEVEVRRRRRRPLTSSPDITILWEDEIPLAARLGASVLVRRGAAPGSREAIAAAAEAEGLSLEMFGEPRLWALLGVPD